MCFKVLEKKNENSKSAKYKCNAKNESWFSSQCIKDVIFLEISNFVASHFHHITTPALNVIVSFPKFCPQASTILPPSITTAAKDVEGFSRRLAALETVDTARVSDACENLKKEFQRLSDDVREHEKVNAEFRQTSRVTTDEDASGSVKEIVALTADAVANLEQNRVAALEARVADLERKLEDAGLFWCWR